MRTTIELPDDLLREAKAASALRGISLKAYITEALVRYRGVGAGGAAEGRAQRVQLPLIGRAEGSRYRLSGEDLEQAMAESENVKLDP